jgi:universal stress protein A
MLLLPLERVLCPVDFSECSYGAVARAVELALKEKAELCLLYVVPALPQPVLTAAPSADAPYAAELADYEEALHTGAQQKLHEVVQKQIPRAVRTRLIVGHGDAAAEIVRIAEAERVGLIVIATHGMSGWRNLALGSVAERVVRMSHKPVLSIRVALER